MEIIAKNNCNLALKSKFQGVCEEVDEYLMHSLLIKNKLFRHIRRYFKLQFYLFLIRRELKHVN